MKISIENLCAANFDITKISALNQKWANNAGFFMNHPRPTDALLYFCGCDAILSYKDRDEDIHISEGSVCFIPHGEMYTWTFFNEHNGNNISCMLFEFLLNSEEGETIELSDSIVVIDSSRIRLCRHLFTDLINEASRPQISIPKTKSVAFSLISAFSEALREDAVSRRNFGCIHEGIRYLEEDPLQEKSVYEIAKLCNVSVNYFERLFKEYSGMTPTKYRLVRKADRAKVMLEMSALGIEQIAEELNFSDCGYFCRCFKKITGMTPTEYRKNAYQNFGRGTSGQ